VSADASSLGGVRQVRRPAAADLAAARRAVRDALPRTPLVPAPHLGRGVLVKAESLLPTGSFKPRGMIAALTAVPPDRSVVVASAGNAALGLTWAAERLGRTVTVVVPRSASVAKVAKLRSHAIDLRQVGASFDEAEAAAVRLADQLGAHYLSAYNDTALIAGLATLGDELEVLDGALTVVCPVGGGGLVSGLCTWAKDLPSVRIVGVVAAASPAMSAAIATGHIVATETLPTLADGLAGNIEAGSVTFDIAAGRLDETVEVSEDEIAAAMRFLALECGLVAEGAGAVASAAILAGRVAWDGQAVAILSGSNVAPALLAKILETATS